MTVSGRVADKCIFVAIYLAAAVLIVWGAGRITDYAVDVRFYRNYLLPWHMRLLSLRYLPVNWPDYIDGNPMAYMQAVGKVMQASGVLPPKSNTNHGHTYRLRKFGNAAYQILLVYKENALVIYGLPKKTFERLDRFVDGQVDPDKGDFTGWWSTDRTTRIGYLKL